MSFSFAQCDEASFIEGTCIEVARGDAVYLVGADLEDGETVIRPLGEDGAHTGAVWVMHGHTVVDALERLQEIASCDACSGHGLVERVRRDDLAAVSEVECDACDGRGWL